MAELATLFKRIGLSDEKALETSKNKKLGPLLRDTLEHANVGETTVEKTVGALYYTLASLMTKKAAVHLQYMSQAISSSKLLSSDQIVAAIKYCEKAPSDAPINDADFNFACGVGVLVSEAEIDAAIQTLFTLKGEELLLKRYQLSGSLLGQLKTKVRWASAQVVKERLEISLLAILGPKDARDDLKAIKKKEKAAKIVQEEPVNDRRTGDLAKSYRFIEEGELSRLHKVGENEQVDARIMTEHLKRTGGIVRTRFPPEPNGFLHIGHAKAININFGFAEYYKGITILRYDDTNPDAEEEVYFRSILEVVEWLGFQPFEITYSSDYFQRLYELAKELILKDKAYVCFCSGEEIHEQRGGESKGPRTECVHRNRPVTESLCEFEKMKNGEYKEGICTLRMKMDLLNPNPQMWDLVAYRVIFKPHFRTLDQWCMYPTYDYTHCLVDSFEDITHSICTLEFTQARESYYWLVDALGLYKPIQSEFGRLNLGNTVTSKRKLKMLVDGGKVDGWDDPRLHTIASLKRRGFTKEAVNAFVREVGVTLSTVTTNSDRLEGFVREHLNEIADRHFLLLTPLKVTFPTEPTIYIDAIDFRELDDDNFYRLAPGKSVGLLGKTFAIKCTSVVKDKAGCVIEVKAEYETTEKKAKVYIQWLNSDAAIKVEARLFDKLLLPADGLESNEDWTASLNPDSRIIMKDALLDSKVLGKDVGYTFQAVRVGYFCIDKDSSGSSLVLNRTVTLKEDSKKD